MVGGAAVFAVAAPIASSVSNPPFHFRVHIRSRP